MIKALIILSTLVAVLSIVLLCTPALWKWLTPSCELHYFDSPKSDANQCWRRDTKLCQKDDNKIVSFKVSIPKEKLEALKIQINDSINRKLDNSNNQRSKQSPLIYDDFQSGFSHKYLYEKILPYWRDEYKWSVWEEKINKFPHFKTNIDGLGIHFMHIKSAAKTDPSNKNVIPILLLHGWPGSFFEFYKFIPYFLEKAKENKLQVELIIPSLPGYGFSDGAEMLGLDLFAVSNIMFKLMYRLGFKENGFYVQGGDWGSGVASVMARMNTKALKGIHVNMLFEPHNDLRYWFKLMVGSCFPSLFFTKSEASKVYPYGERLTYVIRETGYMHLQATRPATIGVGLEDSPVGLAAYIMEKFSVWTNKSFLADPEGGFVKKSPDTGKFSLDEVITNVMIYWHTQSITSSMFLYKNALTKFLEDRCGGSVTNVPMGLANFPNDLAYVPLAFAELIYENIMTYTEMPRGGHFAALEEPELLADDFLKFVTKTEEWIQRKNHKK